MRKTTLTISVDEEKVKALRIYLERKDSKLEDEIVEIFETLCRLDAAGLCPAFRPGHG